MLSVEDRPDKVGFILTSAASAGLPPIALVTRGYRSERGDELVGLLKAALPLLIDEWHGKGEIYGSEEDVEAYLANNPQLVPISQ